MEVAKLIACARDQFDVLPARWGRMIVLSCVLLIHCGDKVSRTLAGAENAIETLTCRSDTNLDITRSGAWQDLEAPTEFD